MANALKISAGSELKDSKLRALLCMHFHSFINQQAASAVFMFPSLGTSLNDIIDEELQSELLDLSRKALQSLLSLWPWVILMSHHVQHLFSGALLSFRT